MTTPMAAADSSADDASHHRTSRSLGTNAARPIPATATISGTVPKVNAAIISSPGTIHARPADANRLRPGHDDQRGRAGVL